MPTVQLAPDGAVYGSDDNHNMNVLHTKEIEVPKGHKIVLKF